MLIPSKSITDWFNSYEKDRIRAKYRRGRDFYKSEWLGFGMSFIVALLLLSFISCQAEVKTGYAYIGDGVTFIEKQEASYGDHQKDSSITAYLSRYRTAYQDKWNFNLNQERDSGKQFEDFLFCAYEKNQYFALSIWQYGYMASRDSYAWLKTNQ